MRENSTARLGWRLICHAALCLFFAMLTGCTTGCASQRELRKAKQTIAESTAEFIVTRDELETVSHQLEVADEELEAMHKQFPMNSTSAPENPFVLMLGDSDLSKDIVRKTADGETVRVHEGWVYRFYPDGGLNSITQLSTDPAIRDAQTH